MQINHTTNSSQNKILEKQLQSNLGQTKTTADGNGKITQTQDLNHHLTAITSPTYISIQSSNGDNKSPDKIKAPTGKSSQNNKSGSNTGGINNGGIPTDNNINSFDDDDEDDYPPLEEEDINMFIQAELRNQKAGNGPKKDRLTIKDEPVANIDLNKLITGSLTDEFNISQINFENCKFPEDFEISKMKLHLKVVFKNCENVNYKYINQNKVSHPDNDLYGTRETWDEGDGDEVRLTVDAQFINQHFSKIFNRQIDSSTKLKQIELDHLFRSIFNSNYEPVFSGLDLSGLNLNLSPNLDNFGNYHFENCNLSNSKIHDGGVGVPYGPRFRNCDLTNANIDLDADTNFNNCNLTNTEILIPEHHLEITEAVYNYNNEFIGSDFSYSDNFASRLAINAIDHQEEGYKKFLAIPGITRMILEDYPQVRDFSNTTVDLSGLSGTEVTLAGIDFTNSVIEKANKSRTVFENCTFNQTNMSGFYFDEELTFSGCAIQATNLTLRDVGCPINYQDCTLKNSKLDSWGRVIFNNSSIIGSNIKAICLGILDSNVISSNLDASEQANYRTHDERLEAIINSLLLFSNIDGSQNSISNINGNTFLYCDFNSFEGDLPEGSATNNQFYQNQGVEDNTESRPSFENENSHVDGTNQTLNNILNGVQVFKFAPNQEEKHIEGFDFSNLTLNGADFTNAILINVDLSEACAENSKFGIDLKNSKNITVDDFRATKVEKIPAHWKSRVIDWNGRISDHRRSPR